MRANIMFLCVLMICLTVIIVSGYGPVVWGGVLAVLGWLLTVWLWFVGLALLIGVIIILFSLLLS